MTLRSNVAKSENKTQPTDVDPKEFIATVDHAVRRADAERMLTIMGEVTGEQPVMWGPSIIGFGSYHYVYASGRQGDAPAAGFSPRKAHLVVYLLGGLEERYTEQLTKLGPHKSSKACLYLKKLDDVDEAVLRFMIKDSYDFIKDEFPDDAA